MGLACQCQMQTGKLILQITLLFPWDKTYFTISSSFPSRSMPSLITVINCFGEKELTIDIYMYYLADIEAHIQIQFLCF